MTQERIDEAIKKLAASRCSAPGLTRDCDICKRANRCSSLNITRAAMQGAEAVVKVPAETEPPSLPPVEELEPTAEAVVTKTTHTLATIANDPTTNQVDILKAEYKSLVPGKAKRYEDAHGLLDDIKAGHLLHRHILLEGKAGTGKTTAAREYAARNAAAYIRIPCSGNTSADDIAGMMTLKDNATVWQDGILTRALRLSHIGLVIVVLDEITAALPEVTFVLHELLDDDGRITLAANDSELVAPDWTNLVIVATCNPRSYTGNNRMNNALLDRFSVRREVPYLAKAAEMRLLLANLRPQADISYKALSFTPEEIATRAVALAQDLRKARDNEDVLQDFGYRRLDSFVNFVGVRGLASSLQGCILNYYEPEERKLVTDLINSHFADLLTDLEAVDEAEHKDPATAADFTAEEV